MYGRVQRNLSHSKGRRLEMRFRKYLNLPLICLFVKELDDIEEARKELEAKVEVKEVPKEFDAPVALSYRFMSTFFMFFRSFGLYYHSSQPSSTDFADIGEREIGFLSLIR